MKPVLLALCLLSVACQTGDKSAVTTTRPAISGIEGNWELVENRVGGKVIVPQRSQQIKVFNDGFFSYLMYNPDGSFHGAGAGTYTIDGNTYTETFRYSSDTTWVGFADQQTWELRGDTLIFAGFKKVLDRAGREMAPGTWGGDMFVEKRVRATL
jgi:hypothetical protein